MLGLCLIVALVPYYCNFNNTRVRIPETHQTVSKTTLVDSTSIFSKRGNEISNTEYKSLCIDLLGLSLIPRELQNEELLNHFRGYLQEELVFSLLGTIRFSKSYDSVLIEMKDSDKQTPDRFFYIVNYVGDRILSIVEVARKKHDAFGAEMSTMIVKNCDKGTLYLTEKEIVRNKTSRISNYKVILQQDGRVQLITVE